MHPDTGCRRAEASVQLHNAKNPKTSKSPEGEMLVAIVIIKKERSSNDCPSLDTCIIH